MRLSHIVGAAIATALSANSPALAADAAGCRDPFDLKRFDGSSIVICQTKNFAEVVLPTGPNTGYDYNAKKGTFASQSALEGRVTQNVYAAPIGTSAAEVFRNYELDLRAKGYTIVYEAKQADLGPAMGQFFSDSGPGTQIFAYSPDEARYAAAVKEADGVKTALALYVVEFVNGYEPKFHPQNGQVMVRLDAVQSGDLRNQMVVVSAADIARSLDQTGKVALYGILFDFNKAAIKPESRPALAEIGKYLAADPSRRLYVVGHTDNVGGFEQNMSLSQARATAVVADLTRTYGIAPMRLRASGVGLLAPVAPNVTEEGRAKNRRVELLPQ